MVGTDNGVNSDAGLLPHEILINILKRLPVKSLIRFKCVSKYWLNLFETPYFVAQHLHHSSLNLLLLRSSYLWSLSPLYSLIAPDFNIHDVDFLPPRDSIIASCNGLLCVQHPDFALSLFNPATRQIKHLPQSLIHTKCAVPFCRFGLGFSPLLNDYNFVRITVFVDEDEVVPFEHARVSRAEVFSLTAGSWTEIDLVNLPTVCVVSDSVAANGAIFWQATMATDPDSEFVVSFDIGLQVFTLLNGPPPPPSSTLVNNHYSNVSAVRNPYSNTLAVYNDKLAMFRQFIVGNYESCSIDLWVLEHTHAAAVRGECWIKMYSVRHPSRILYPLSIWRDEIVCRHAGESVGGNVLSLFSPYTNELKKLPARRDEFYHFYCNYVESLVPVGNRDRSQ